MARINHSEKVLPRPPVPCAPSERRGLGLSRHVKSTPTATGGVCPPGGTVLFTARAASTM